MSIRHLFAASILSMSFPCLTMAGPILTINTDAKGGVGQLATVTFQFQGASETGLAGTLVTTLPSGQKVDTYCIDLHDTTYVGNGGSNWSAEVLPISSFANYASGANWGSLGYLFAKYDPTVATRIDGAALQVALWKVEYDGSADFTKGSFLFSDSSNLQSDQHLVYQRANQLLAGFKLSNIDTNETFFRATSHPNALYQDLIGPGGVSTNDVVVASVPEPASIAAVASGLGILGLARGLRRRRS